ncbi:hypothetical protein D3C72_468140 [compost metagenome]
MKTELGAWISGEPVVKLDVSDEGKLGALVIQTLNASRQGIAHPPTWEGLTVPLLNASGAKTWLGFARTARLVSLELDGDEVVFTPTNREGRSFLFKPDQSLRSDLAESAIVAALKSAFEIST